MKNFNQALEIDPKFGKAYYQRGMIYETNRNTSQAVEELKKAKSLGYYIDPVFIESVEKKAQKKISWEYKSFAYLNKKGRVPKTLPFFLPVAPAFQPGPENLPLNHLMQRILHDALGPGPDQAGDEGPDLGLVHHHLHRIPVGFIEAGDGGGQQAGEQVHDILQQLLRDIHLQAHHAFGPQRPQQQHRQVLHLLSAWPGRFPKPRCWR